MQNRKEKEEKFEQNCQKEWLLTNGIGGYASSTIYGLNTRKYHGLLVAATLDKGQKRMLTLAKVDESILIGEQSFSIATNECYQYREMGYLYQEAFEKKYLPEFLYEVNGVKILKKMAMVYGENKIAIQYHIVNTLEQPISFQLVPFVNYRDFHIVQNAACYSQKFERNCLEVDLDTQNHLYMEVTDASYQPYDATFYENMFYRIERERGFADTESHYMPGKFFVSIEAESQKEIFVVAEVGTSCTIEEKRIPSLVRSEMVRLEKVCKVAGASTEIEKSLAIAADCFIIKKGKAKTIIAGYPWFEDWGRDAFIALEGIALKTNRFQDAKEILLYFGEKIHNGLIPNFIGEDGTNAYNTVDASLWYIEAMYQYFQYTNDKETVKFLYPKLIEIITAYQNGTDYHIQMASDGLIMAGNANTQLTWMDAKVGEIIPTPRNGKAVEINALWYNALKIMEKFYFILGEENAEFDCAEENGMLHPSALENLARNVKDSFKKFYQEEGLLDTIEPFREEVRPNQLLAISLSHPVVTGEKAEEILEVVTKQLVTPKGLKTLSSKEKGYIGRYEGNPMQRDLAYHQGTVWPWLLGEYAKAYEKVKKQKYGFPFISELLKDGCIGNVAEIYDAEEPQRPNGAFAQAWSVAAMEFLK